LFHRGHTQTVWQFSSQAPFRRIRRSLAIFPGCMFGITAAGRG
jgi:hypothetical protein